MMGLGVHCTFLAFVCGLYPESGDGTIVLFTVSNKMAVWKKICIRKSE